MQRATFIFLLITLLLPGGLSACASAKPYEREYLTRPGMDTSKGAEDPAFLSHVHNSREGAQGGAGLAGGGCGCN